VDIESCECSYDFCSQRNVFLWYFAGSVRETRTQGTSSLNATQDSSPFSTVFPHLLLCVYLPSGLYFLLLWGLELIRGTGLLQFVISKWNINKGGVRGKFYFYFSKRKGGETWRHNVAASVTVHTHNCWFNLFTWFRLIIFYPLETVALLRNI
jgi:hypothetical protein